MAITYWKLAWRNLTKDRHFTLLNLTGLSTGLAAALLIFLWVTDEKSVDRFHHNDALLYQVMSNQQNADGIQTMAATNSLLARTLKTEMPEVALATASLDKGWFGATTFSAGTDAAHQTNVQASGHFAEPDFFSVFTYPLLQGDASLLLKNKNEIVLSEDLARRLFHTTTGVIGQTVQWQHEMSFTVTGIFQTPPAGSSDQFDYVLPMEKFLELNPYQKNWGQSADPATYVVLRPGTSVAAFNRKLAGFMKTKVPQSNEALFARPYARGYLYGLYENGKEAGGRIAYVRIFSLIAIFILVIACINFMNLATAKSSRRMKEVGIRKVVGSTRLALVGQYLAESMLMSGLALLMAVALVAVLLPAFNQLTGKALVLSFRPGFTFGVVAITLFTGLLAGSYPAIYLSGFQPVAVLKGKLTGTLGELWVRKGLVVFQFTITVVFIVGVLVVYRQVHYIQTKDLGYNKDNVLSFDMRGLSAGDTETFLAVLKNQPGIVNATSLDHADLYTFGGSVPYIEGKPPKDVINIRNLGVNYGMLETMKMTIVSGRPFSKSASADTAEVILNEAAVRAYNLTDPIGKHMQVFNGDRVRKIVGVVKDFHFQSLHETIGPFALRLVPEETDGMLVRLRAGSEKQSLARLQALFALFHPGYPFVYRFLDETFQSQYVSEVRVERLCRWFGGLAILISCLGLFGLAAFTAERRFREIGIRKVLGATARSLVWLLTADFLRLIIVAVCFAFPIAWWATNLWLNSFAYRIHPGPGIFLLSALFIVGITLVTIGFQAVRAATSNPVRSMRSE